MTFFALAADPNKSSLQDNVLKSEINNIRNVLSSTNYKTKLVVVLLGDDTVVSSILDDRSSNIRRSCTLDAKSLYFLPATASPVEVAEFVQTLLTTLHPMCVEYYRDLSKHARRKRNRGSIPLPTIAPTAGTSLILPMQGWNSRYEFKLGVFAEFRQEMDAACRNYESAYESLFSPELFESIPSWSRRFNEARLLADAIAIRIIRCQLWTEQPTGAVRSWRNHRDRIRSILNKQENGTENYGWEAWESMWSKIMAEIVARVDLASLSLLDSQSEHISSIFASSEKALPTGERIGPWEQLHHAGYWLVKAVKHIQKRKALALQIPEKDRASPGESTASDLVSKRHLYDTYLAPEPFAERPLTKDGGYDYRSDVIDALKAAMESFAARGQLRTNERLQVEEATELLEEEAWTDAAFILTGLWKHTKWRSAGWFNFLSRVGWALFQCATQSQDQDLLIRLMWELSSRVFPAEPEFAYDLHAALAKFESTDSRPAVVLSTDEIVSSILPSFAFAKAEGNVGQPLKAQLCLMPHLQTDAAPIRFAEIKIVFDGGLRPIHLLNDEDISASSKPVEIVAISLEDSSSLSTTSKKRSSAGAIASLTGRSNLSIKPHDTKIYMFSIVPREAGEVKIASITMIVEDPRFSLTIVSSDLADAMGHWWEMKHDKPVSRLFGMERDATEVKILPKPPMVRIHAPGLKLAYYTNESVQMPIHIINEEEDTVKLSIQGRLISPRAHAASLKWADNDAAARPESESEIGVLVLPERPAGILAASESTSFTLLMNNTLDALDHELEIVARYHIASDPETPLVKVMTLDLPFIRPFEANYSFSARHDDESWPDFFKAPGPGEAHATGLKQKYMVKASLYSFASGELDIDSVRLMVHRVVGGAICTAFPGHRKANVDDNDPSKPAATSNIIAPDETQDYCFDLMAQKIKLGDRHAVGLDSTLEITWRRPGSGETAISTLEIPRFVAPMAEPRVLLTDPMLLQALDPSAGLAIYQLRFTVENPSMHFLTFNLTMESSEDFAFSGPKATSMSLVPVSRHTVEYRLLLSKMNAWIGVNLGVVDAYFGKQLRVLPAGDGVRSDKKGNVSVWIP